MLPPSVIKSREIGHRADRFKAQIKRARAARELARTEAVKPLGSVFVDVLETVSPRDTNRFIAAWQQAGNDAGLPHRAVERVKDSDRRDEWIAALESQVGYWYGQAEYFKGLMASYEKQDAQNPRRKDGTPRAKRTASPSYRKYARQHAKALREAAKAEEILGEALGSEGFLIFDKGGFAEGRAARFGKRKRFRTTIRTKRYGGRGEIIDAGGVTLVRLHNLEPHATIVANSARHGRPVRYAYAAVRAIGGERVTKSYIDAIGRVTGWTETPVGVNQMKSA